MKRTPQRRNVSTPKKRKVEETCSESPAPRRSRRSLAAIPQDSAIIDSTKREKINDTKPEEMLTPSQSDTQKSEASTESIATKQIESEDNVEVYDLSSMDFSSSIQTKDETKPTPRRSRRSIVTTPKTKDTTDAEKSIRKTLLSKKAELQEAIGDGSSDSELRGLTFEEIKSDTKPKRTRRRTLSPCSSLSVTSETSVSSFTRSKVKSQILVNVLDDPEPRSPRKTNRRRTTHLGDLAASNKAPTPKKTKQK